MVGLPNVTLDDRLRLLQNPMWVILLLRISEYWRSCQPNHRVFRQGSYVGLRELLPDVELQDDDRNLGVVRFEPMNHRRPNGMRSGETHHDQIRSRDHRPIQPHSVVVA